MNRYWARLRDERGSVGVLLSLVIFTVVGMLMMTFNTVQLSKEKMRLQNAADSAALEHALWQARSMNALQNLNDEGYVTAQTASLFLSVAVGLESAAKGVQLIPVVGPIIAGALRIGVVMVGGMSSIMSNIVLKFAIPISSFFYARIAVPLGYVGAQQFAYANGATALLPSINALQGKVFGNLSLGFYAIGFSPSAPISTFVLPIEQRSMNERPYKCDNAAQRGVLEVSTWGGVYSALHIGADWDFKPWVSKGLYDEIDEWERKKKRDEERKQMEKDLEEMIQSHINTDKARIRMANEDIEALKNEIKPLQERKHEYEVRGEPVPEELEEEINKHIKHMNEIAQELTDAGLGLNDDVNDPEWIKRARERACKDLGIDDPSGKKKDDDKKKEKPKLGKPKLPGATIWIAMKAKNSIHTLPLAAWSSHYAGAAMDDSPMIAVAAAKCITGDLIPHNKKSKQGKVNQRPSGFGIGATAKLIPVERALAEIESGALKKVLATIVGGVVYH